MEIRAWILGCVKMRIASPLYDSCHHQIWVGWRTFLKLVISHLGHLSCSELQSNSDIYWSQHFIKTHKAEFVNVTVLSECICKLCQSIYIFEEREERNIFNRKWCPLNRYWRVFLVKTPSIKTLNDSPSMKREIGDAWNFDNFKCSDLGSDQLCETLSQPLIGQWLSTLDSHWSSPWCVWWQW